MNKYILSNIESWHYTEDHPQMMPKGSTVDIEAEGKELEVSDGYHTMSELYRHRFALWMALCKIYDNYKTPLDTRVKCWKTRTHSDDSSYDGWFLLGMTVQPFKGETHQITYHLPIEYWDMINVISLPQAPPYDGHTSEDVLKRLLDL